MTIYDEADILVGRLDSASAVILYAQAARLIHQQRDEIEQLRAENSELRRRVGVMGNQTTKEAS